MKKIYYGKAVYDNKEIKAVINSARQVHKDRKIQTLINTSNRGLQHKMLNLNKEIIY